MKTYLLLLIVIFSFFHENSFGADFWLKCNGPFGAEINSIAADDNTGDIFIATSGNGVFLLKKDIQHWQSLNDNVMKYNFKVNEIVKIKNAELFALTDSSGILKRAGDDSWVTSNVGLGGHLTFKSIIKIKEDIYVTGSIGRAIFRTTNGGESWSNYNSGLLPEENINALCMVKNIVFCGTDRGIFKSSDEGKKWLKVNDETGKVNKIFFDESSNNMIAVTSKGVFLSKDLGISWQWKNSGLENETDVLTVGKFNDSLIIGTRMSGLLISGLDDISWHAANNLIEEKNIRVIHAFQNELLIGTNREFYTVDNYVKSKIVEGIPVLNIRGFVENNYVILTATDIGIFKSTNFGLNWEAVNKGLNEKSDMTCILSTASGKLIAGSTTGLYYSDNHGETWIKYFNNELNNERIICLALDSNQTVYAGTASKGVYKTSEDRWLQMNGGNIETNEILSLIVVNGNYIYAGTKANGLFRKAPFDEWRKVTNIGTAIYNVTSLEYKENEGLLFAASNYGVMRSRDNGTIWTKTTGTLSSQVIALLSYDKDTIFAGLKNIPGIYRTVNNGETWTGLYDQSGLNKHKVTNLFESKSGFIFAGTNEGGCFRSVATSIDMKPEPPVLTVLGELEFCEGEFCVLDAGENYNEYLWSDGITSRYDTVWTQGKYWVKVKNVFGFDAISDTVTVKVESKPLKPNILYNGDVLFCAYDAAKYIWFFEDEIIEGANQKVYKPLESGWYKCEVFTDLGCTNVSDAVRVELTGMEVTGKEQDLLIYPNPTECNLYINVSDNNKIIDLEIVNVLGNVVSNPVFEIINNEDLLLNLETLPSGLYFVRCITQDKIYYLKFIKN